ncbi:MAG: ABC transporter permease [Povalibacter sp.]
MNTPISISRFDFQRNAPMTLARVLRAYFIEAKHECLRILRTPGLSVPMLALPTLLYVLLGMLVFGENTAKDPQLALYMFASYVVFGATTPGMFGFGVGLAVERQSGLLKLKRAQPMPLAAHLIAKLTMAIVIATLVTSVLMVLATTFGHVTLGAMQVIGILGVTLLSAIASCAIGFFIGATATGTAANGIVNLIYFPMMYLSGMFFPLPKFLATWAVIWPTFYADQLVIAAAGGKSFMDSAMCIAVLTGIAVLFGGLAIRALVRKG